MIRNHIQVKVSTSTPLNLIIIASDFENRLYKLHLENQNLRSLLKLNQDVNSIKSYSDEYTKLESEALKNSKSGNQENTDLTNE
jgi:cell shape-determining protein MreC